MKKAALLFTALILVLCMTCGMLISCGKSGSDDTGTGAGTGNSIVGQWILPDSAKEGTLEAYVFDKDGTTFHYYQLSTDYRILNTIDGTYELSTGTGDASDTSKTEQVFTITMMGYPLTYTYVISADGQSMTMSDHGTDAVCTRYNGTLVQ